MLLVQNILNYLETHDLKISEFAKQCDLKTSTVSSILNGYTKSPTIEVVSKIAKTMGVTIDELTKNDKRANDEIQKIYDNVKDLDDGDKAKIYAMIQGAIKATKEFNKQ